MDKASVYFIFSVTAAQKRKHGNFDIMSAFTSKTYQNDKPLYVKQMHLFDATMLHPGKPVKSQKLNLYERKTAAHICHTHQFQHLEKYGYHPTSADPCLLIKKTPQRNVFDGIVIENFIISAPSQTDVDSFGFVSREKPTV